MKRRPLPPIGVNLLSRRRDDLHRLCRCPRAAGECDDRQPEFVFRRSWRMEVVPLDLVEVVDGRRFWRADRRAVPAVVELVEKD